MGSNTSGVSATTTAISTEVRYRTGGGEPVIVHYPEAASGDFKKGELVLISSGGILQIGTAPAAKAASAVLNTANVPIVGMALADASGTTANLIPVVVANADTEFLFRVYDDTATTAVLSNIAIGDFAEVIRYNSGATIQTVITDSPDGTSLAENQVVVTEVPQFHSSTDQYPWVWCKVLYSSRAVA
jgi:hypothetical protein